MVRLTVLEVAVLRLALMAGLAVAATAGCGADTPATTSTPANTATTTVAVAAATPSTTASASADAPATDRISASGIGPFVVAAPLAQLQSSGAVSNVQPVAQCPDWATADGTGDYAFVHATFTKGALVWIAVTDTTVSTVEGAQLGMALDEVVGMYSGKGVPLADAGGAKALGVVGESNTGLLFRTNADVAINVIEAGSYDLLKTRFVNGKAC